MTAFAALTLADGQTTPANVTFNPSSIDSDGVASYLTSDSVFDSKKKVTIKVQQPKNGSSVSRVTLRVAVPIMDTVDTSKKVGECLATVNAVIPKVSSEQQRKDIRAFVANLLDHAAVTAAFVNVESIY